MTEPNTADLQPVADLSPERLAQYMGQAILAVDCEMDGLNLHRDQIRLVQLCDRQGTTTLIRPVADAAPPRLRTLLEASGCLKVFHFALADVAFILSRWGVEVASFCCTKVMSKLVRTYTGAHSLSSLTQELLEIKLDKSQQTSHWGAPCISARQLEYAAADVAHLIPIHDRLQEMMRGRGKMPCGIALQELNERTQSCLPHLVQLLCNGYGDADQGWRTSVFHH